MAGDVGVFVSVFVCLFSWHYKSTSTLLVSFRQRLEEERRAFEAEEERRRNLVGTFIITAIIITRPKPAYGRLGLAGSWGQDTDEVSTFLVFLMSHFAPAALSSDLTNLGPVNDNENPPGNLEKPWKPTKNHEKP